MKKITAFALAIIMFCSCCCFVSANDDADFSTETEQISGNARYTHLSAVSAGIKEKALGFVYCESTYGCMLQDYTFVLTCTLQRTDGSVSGWQTYKTATETFTEIGHNGMSRNWFAPAGYAYRTFTTIVIKNSRTGKVVETATCDSPVIYK